jgi:hypothetical protein
MRKGFLIVLAVVLVAALAAPAMAAMDVTGFVRTKGYVSNFKNGATAPVLKENAPDAAYVEQRFRAKFSFGEENVKAVWFLETDFGAFGDSAGNAAPGGAARNTGGALGGDKVNTETKNIYVWFKLPDTSLEFTVGLQNQTDSYAGVLFGGADMAGIFVSGKYEPVSYTVGWAKLYENNNLKTDDLTLYALNLKFSLIKDLNMGLNFYFIQDDTQKDNTAGVLPFPGVTGDENKKRIYTLGPAGSYNAGPVTISGFFFHQFGTVDFLTPPFDSNVDINGWAADLRVDANIGPGKGFIEGLYISGDDNPDDDTYKGIVTLSDANASPGGNSFYSRTDMMILLPNADDINTSSSLIGAAGVATAGGTFVGSTSPSNGGRGIWHIGAGYTMKLMDKLTGKLGAGYLAAVKELKGSGGTAGIDDNKKGKTMGTEVNANVNYNIMKGLDFGLYGAYCWLGDFYQSKVSGAKDPDNVYDMHFRLNYAF